MLHTLVTPSSLLPRCFPPHCVRTAISPPRRRSATFLALYYTDNFHPFSLPVSPARTIISSSRINCLLKYSNPLPQHAVVPLTPQFFSPTLTLTPTLSSGYQRDPETICIFLHSDSPFCSACSLARASGNLCILLANVIRFLRAVPRAAICGAARALGESRR